MSNQPATAAQQTPRHALADDIAARAPFGSAFRRLIRWYLHRLADKYDRRYGTHHAADGRPF